FNERLEEVRKNFDTQMQKYVDFQMKRKGLSSLLNVWTEIARRARPFFPVWEKRWFEIQHRFIGTFMVTNMGTLGVIDCHGQLVKPSIAALLVLSSKDVAEITPEGKPVSRKYLGLALEFDHRVTDAGESGRFLATIKRNLEEPEKYCI
ncbi:MAG: 2-oxo acid dehydrogenase subunit E2, partial [Deltaproteobacteria bacterium]|nr:2-oxo acid dehydrogenase subunit E2 [Deltaproteobacteria bacterium]